MSGNSDWSEPLEAGHRHFLKFNHLIPTDYKMGVVLQVFSLFKSMTCKP
jgi:hypothetical protein